MRARRKTWTTVCFVLDCTYRKAPIRKSSYIIYTIENLKRAHEWIKGKIGVRFESRFKEIQERVKGGMSDQKCLKRI